MAMVYFDSMITCNKAKLEKYVMNYYRNALYTMINVSDHNLYSMVVQVPMFVTSF